MTDTPHSRSWPILVGVAIFLIFGSLVVAWPLGNMAETFGRERRGETLEVLAGILVVSIAVYLTQRLRRNPDGERTASFEILLASAASILAIHIRTWTGVGHAQLNTELGLPFVIVGFVNMGRALIIDWTMLSSRARWLSFASDVYLAAAAVLQLLRLGFDDLGFARWSAVPGWAVGLAGQEIWIGILAFGPLVAALAIITQPRKGP